jgi:3-deoxy-D-manno-octulosonic-acid transferase
MLRIIFKDMSLRIDPLLYKKEKSLWTKIYLFPLYLLSIPYRWAVQVRVFFYDVGLLKTKRLSCPVISVGNITVGGTGKTPFVMFLARGLKERGITIAILSRGYRRKQSSDSLVSDGQNIFLSPEEAGDEPYLMATTHKDVPVLVSKDRFVTGQMALQRFGVRGLLLDDGYQHLQLHRNLNILLIDSNVGFGDNHLLPRGILREPLSHLQRADLFILTKVEEPKACLHLEKKLHQIHPRVEVFHSHYESIGLVNPKGEAENLQALRGKKVLALSGIANPDYFSFLLKKCGMEIGKEIIFPDHHFYTIEDLTSIEENSKGMNWVVTTEKDMLKLQTLGIDHLPIRALRIEMKIWEEEEFFKRIMQLFPGKEERRN